MRFWAFSFILLLIGSLGEARAKPAVEFPPDKFLPGWNAEKIQQYRTPADLFAYMDGGAELYLEYYFHELLVRQYHHAQLGDLTIEAYLFAHPEDAWGIFGLDTTGVLIELGQGCRTPSSPTGGSVRFWKGTAFVRIFSWQSNPEVLPVMEIAARLTEAKLAPGGDLPPWLEKLRRQNWDPVFVRGEIALRQVAGSLALDNLPLNSQTGAAWIPPDSCGLLTPCLILRYSDELTAQSAFTQLWDRLGASRAGSVLVKQRGLMRRQDHGVAGLERVGVSLLLAPSAADEAACANTLDAIRIILLKEEE